MPPPPAPTLASPPFPAATPPPATPGKSTLINALVGQKLSIVTFKPQTTRHRVVGIASEPAYQMILFDTPGIMREARSKLDERMMAAVVSSIKAAEAIIAVVDAGRVCSGGGVGERLRPMLAAT
jgi:small GTP-binding protein